MRTHKSINKNILGKIKFHIYENKEIYIICALFFIIGVIVGVIFFNNIEDNMRNSTNDYINDFVNKIKNGYIIDRNELLKQIIIKDLIFTFIMWLMGCTVIGLPVVYGMISLKGFTLGYTICSIIISFGTKNGIIFCLSSLLLQNIIAIPIYWALAVSGNKLYKSIIKDKRRENIKIEILRHTFFSIFMSMILLISAVIEAYISSALTELYLNII